MKKYAILTIFTIVLVARMLLLLLECSSLKGIRYQVKSVAYNDLGALLIC